jgi:hypothetical protein
LTISSPLPFGGCGIGGGGFQLGHEQVRPLDLYGGRDSACHPVLDALCAPKFGKRKQASDLGWATKLPDQISVGFFGHELLNTMFTEKAIMAFNNTVFKSK